MDKKFQVQLKAGALRVGNVEESLRPENPLGFLEQLILGQQAFLFLQETWSTALKSFKRSTARAHFF